LGICPTTPFNPGPLLTDSDVDCAPPVAAFLIMAHVVTVKFIPKTAEDLADQALMEELAASGALTSPGIYTVEDLQRVDAELRAQDK